MLSRLRKPSRRALWRVVARGKGAAPAAVTHFLAFALEVAHAARRDGIASDEVATVETGMARARRRDEERSVLGAPSVRRRVRVIVSRMGTIGSPPKALLVGLVLLFVNACVADGSSSSESRGESSRARR